MALSTATWNFGKRPKASYVFFSCVRALQKQNSVHKQISRSTLLSNSNISNSSDVSTSYQNTGKEMTDMYRILDVPS